MISLLLALTLVLSPASAGPKKKAQPVAPPPVEAAAPAIDPAFEADIRRLLDVTGSAALGKQAMDQMLVSLRPLAPQLPETFWAEIAKEVDANQLVELTVPIYARHLSPQDVKDLLVFYESPVGQKMIAVQPAINAEAMAAGQVWGQEVGARIMEKILAQPSLE